MGGLHIYAPPAIKRRIWAADCPVCGKWTRLMGFFYEWHGWTTICLRCGDRWSDGEIHERPFMRGWRQKSVADAKAHWRRAALAEEE